MKGERFEGLIKTGTWGKRVKLLDADLGRLDDPRASKVLTGAYFLPLESRIAKLPIRFHPASSQNVICCGSDVREE